MAQTITTMPSSTITTTSTEDIDSPDGPTAQGFPAVNGTPSPASSVTSPNRSPREPQNGFDKMSEKRKRSESMERHYDYSPPKRVEHMADRALQMVNSNAVWQSPTGSERPYHWNRSEENDTPPPTAAGQVTDSAGTPPARPGGPVVQIAKRKRNFSNRTKTGCMTCRSRKKKCDEGRPTCNNCQRGGFECQGYTVVRGVWPSKTNGTKAPIPLQAKDDQPDSHNSLKRQDLTTASTDSAQFPPVPEPRSRSSYSGQTWPPQQGHPTYNEQPPLPPLSELANASSISSTRDMSRPPSQQHIPPPAPNPQSGHWHQDYRSNFPPAPPSAPPPPPLPRLDTYQQQQQQPPQPQQQHAPPMRMQTSGDYHKSGAKTFTVEEVERSRMLRHTRFNYFDPTLKNERQRCSEALARYNSACMLRSGISEQEAQNMLMKVFDPSLDTTHSLLAPCKEKGVLGPGVKIESPFKCTYGYNLRVMDNVFIGENTRIDDSARVEIGARTWIGPNVTILTNDVCKDMVDRKGTESACRALPVTIASEVVIGSNAVIYPGVSLGRGSTVEPFALVKDSLGENQILTAAVGQRSN